MKKKILVTVFAMVLVLAVVQVAGAWPGGHGGSGPVNRPNPVKDLGLTDEQVAQIQDLHRETYGKTRELKIKLMDSMFALRQLRLQKDTDQAAIDAKIKGIKDLRDQLRQAVQEKRQRMESILTSEQKRKMESWRKSHDRHHGK